MRASSSDKRSDKSKKGINSSFEELEKTRKNLERQSKLMEIETNRLVDLLRKDSKNERLQKDKTEFTKALENLKKEKQKAEQSFNNYRLTKLFTKLAHIYTSKSAKSKKEAFFHLRDIRIMDDELVEKVRKFTKNRNIYGN